MADPQFRVPYDWKPRTIFNHLTIFTSIRTQRLFQDLSSILQEMLKLTARYPGADIHIPTFGVAGAIPTSRSANPMHATATPTCKRTVCWTEMVRYQLASEILRPKKDFNLPQMALRWDERPFIGLRGPFMGVKGPSFRSKKRILFGQEVHMLA